MGKKGRKRLQTNPGILKTTHLACHTWVRAPTFDAVINCHNWPIKCLAFRGAEMNFRGRVCETKIIFFVLERVDGDFREIQLESKWNTTIWVFPTENFRQQQNFWKSSPVFPDGIFQTEIRVPFLQSSLKPSLIPVSGLHGRISGKWNWFLIYRFSHS